MPTVEDAVARPRGTKGNKSRKGPMKTVSIFGSSLPHEGTAAYDEARTLGRLLAEAGLAVCNGGYGGLMEASARGAGEAGGHTVGITCTLWPSAANRWIAEEVRTKSFLERLTTLIERGDAYVVLPGGTGTLAELALVWEMMNKSTLSKTVGGRKPLLVMVPYWQPVVECLNQEASLGGDIGPPFQRRPRAMEIVHLMTDVGAVAAHLKTALAG
jgi:uncharacterized protein (TIGR00730 family)